MPGPGRVAVEREEDTERHASGYRGRCDITGTSRRRGVPSRNRFHGRTGMSWCASRSVRPRTRSTRSNRAWEGPEQRRRRSQVPSSSIPAQRMTRPSCAQRGGEVDAFVSACGFPLLRPMVSRRQDRSIEVFQRAVGRRAAGQLGQRPFPRDAIAPVQTLWPEDLHLNVRLIGGSADSEETRRLLRAACSLNIPRVSGAGHTSAEPRACS